MSLYKIVVRETQNYRTIQVHEVYKTNVGTKLQELLEEAEKYNKNHSFTITKL